MLSIYDIIYIFLKIWPTWQKIKMIQPCNHVYGGDFHVTRDKFLYAGSLMDGQTHIISHDLLYCCPYILANLIFLHHITGPSWITPIPFFTPIPMDYTVRSTVHFLRKWNLVVDQGARMLRWAPNLQRGLAHPYLWIVPVPSKVVPQVGPTARCKAGPICATPPLYIYKAHPLRTLMVWAL